MNQSVSLITANGIDIADGSQVKLEVTSQATATTDFEGSVLYG